MSKVEYVYVPRFDPSLETATIVEWKKKSGKVQEGEVIVVLMGEKVQFEVKSPCTGTITKVFYMEGQEVNVGEKIAEIQCE